jgi:hypothetical protein
MTTRDANLDQKQMRDAAKAQGISTADLKQILMANPGLAEKIAESFGAELESGRYGKMADTQISGSRDGVGPYNMTVATPWTAMSQGLDRGLGRYKEKQGVEKQQTAQRALIDGLRNVKGPMGGGQMPGAEDLAGSAPMAAYEDQSMGAGLQADIPQPPQRLTPSGYEQGPGQAQAMPMQPPPQMPPPQPIGPQGGPPPGGPQGPPPMGGPGPMPPPQPMGGRPPDAMPGETPQQYQQRKMMESARGGQPPMGGTMG